MKNVRMALCFLDEEENIVAKKDLNVTWEIKIPDDKGMLENIIIMDEVSKILTYQLKLDIERGAVRELLDEVQRKVK